MLALAIILTTALSVPPVPLINQTAVLDAPSPTVSPTFGIHVGISGGRIIASGADPSKSGGAVGQIATFEFQPTGEWKAFREMQAVEQVMPGEMALGRIALGGSILLASIERRDGSSSSVATFQADATNSGWKQDGRLVASAGPPEPAFGGSLATDGVIVGVSTVDMRVLGELARTVQVAPKVFLFNRTADGWNGMGYLQREAEKQPTFFGASLAMTPGQIVIGCPKAIPAAPHQKLVTGGESVVVIYKLNAQGQWAIDGELTPPENRRDYLGFGTVVAADASTVAVRLAQVTGPGAAVLVYRRGDTGWTYDGELKPLGDVTTGAGWGIALGISQGQIVVGDPTATTAGQSPGYVGCFVRTAPGSWSEALRLMPTVPVATSRWGVALRVDGRRVVVARSQNERDGIMPGGALLFTLPPASETVAPLVTPGETAASSTPLLAPTSTQTK
ncbi:MAG: hypothetical protein EXS17_06700 [Phycisphaerales bacterium]|nr:hypothetical protein [Phycisphaerales bacterium]